jgi:hypothetical protein
MKRDSGVPNATERAAPWIAALAVALPVLAYRYPPMQDLPNHEEVVAAMRHFSDRGRYPAGLHVWNLGHPNQLFYFMAWALTLVTPVDAACKIAVAGCLAATPLAAARLAEHLGSTRWAAVAVAPLALGFAFYWGFVGSLLGLSILLASLPLIDAMTRAPTVGRATLTSLVFLLLYLAHESALVCGCLALVVLSLGRPVGLRPALVRAMPLLAAGLVILFEQVRAVRSMGPNLSSLPGMINLALWQKIDGAPEALLGLHGETATQAPFILILASVVFLCVDRARLGGFRTGMPLRDRFDAHRFELLGALLVVTYFVFPFSIQGAMWLHARFLAPGVAILAVAVAPRRDVPSIITRVACVASIGAVLRMLRPEFDATSALYRSLDPLLADIEPGCAVAAVDLVGGPFPNLVFTVGGAAVRAATERGGRMAVSFLQTSPIPPIIIAREHRWDGAMQRMEGDGAGLRPAFDLKRFRYVLAMAQGEQADQLAQAMAPEARLVARSGAWFLFESTLALAPITATEPVVDGSESVGDRLAALARKAGATPQ